MLNYKLALKKQKGFTLIELMMVVTIIGILSAIAYPSYQEAVKKSRRSDSKGALLGLANAMERHFTENSSYCGAGTTNSTECSAAATGLPTIYATSSPIGGSTAYYNLTISAATATSYTLSATPINAQANDYCGTLTIDETGNKDITNAPSDDITKSDCW